MRRSAFCFGFVTILASVLAAAGVDKTQIKVANVSFFAPQGSTLRAELLSGELEKAISAASLKVRAFSAKKIADVSDVKIVFVRSALGGEAVTGKSSTTLAHSKAGAVRVITVTSGYGGHDYDTAAYNGRALTKVSSDGFDANGDKIIDGWIDVWEFDASGGGAFSVKSRSMNATKQSASKSIVIR